MRNFFCSLISDTCAAIACNKNKFLIVVTLAGFALVLGFTLLIGQAEDEIMRARVLRLLSGAGFFLKLALSVLSVTALALLSRLFGMTAACIILPILSIIGALWTACLFSTLGIVLVIVYLLLLVIRTLIACIIAVCFFRENCISSTIFVYPALYVLLSCLL